MGYKPFIVTKPPIDNMRYKPFIVTKSPIDNMGYKPFIVTKVSQFPNDMEKQGITHTLALPIDKMLYIYLLCPHSEHQKILFQSKQYKHFHQKSRFPRCETGLNKVKLPKVGSNVIVPIPVGAEPNKPLARTQTFSCLFHETLLFESSQLERENKRSFVSSCRIKNRTGKKMVLGFLSPNPLSPFSPKAITIIINN
jgi:hypothetical protein